MAPTAPPARAPPARISNNTYHGAGGYRDVTNHYDEDEGGEAVDEFEGEADQGEGEGEYELEEAHEEDPDPEVEHEEDYPGGEPVEYDEEEQGHYAHNYEGYGAGHMVEEDEYEHDGGYGHQASRRW